MTVIEELRRLAADILEIDLEDLPPESSSETIESWDSVQHLNLVLAIEEQYGIQLDPEQIGGGVTLEDLAELVESAQGE